jgi:hypothetical protein
LYNCQRVDDAIVPVLAEHATLQWIDLTDTKVTAEGIAKLRESRPQLKIVWQPAS